MAIIQEVFLETEWDGEEEARAARDSRVTQLQEQGLVCTCENLYNVAGYRVFVLRATEAEAIDSTPANPRSIQLRRDSSNSQRGTASPRPSEEPSQRERRHSRHQGERRIPYEER